MISPVLDNLIDDAFKAVDKARINAHREKSITHDKDAQEAYELLDEAIDCLERIGQGYSMKAHNGRL